MINAEKKQAAARKISRNTNTVSVKEIKKNQREQSYK
jgi:hypothetical protein